MFRMFVIRLLLASAFTFYFTIFAFGATVLVNYEGMLSQTYTNMIDLIIIIISFFVFLLQDFSSLIFLIDCVYKL